MTHSNRRRARRAQTALFEACESRRLLSSITLSGGLLTVNGDSSTTLLAVDYVNGAVVAQTNQTTKTFAKSSVSGIRINGGSQGEYIAVTSKLSIPATIYGNGGNDTVWAGSGNDLIYGGDGNDQIHARDGNDVIYGDAGNDQLDGGNGVDKASGGTGTNNLTSIDGAPSSGSGTGSTGSTGSAGSSGSGGATITPPPVSSGSGTPVAVITALSTSIAQNQGIHVNAVTGSVLNSGSAITARYIWDFGDAGSKYNKLEGFNAAHAYDSPGTYTITLTLTNEAGKTSQAKRTITVTPANRRQIYVSSAGSDSNNGSTSSLAVRTIARAGQLLGNSSNMEILLRRGDRFTVTYLRLGGQNVLLGAYGSGDRPILEGTGTKKTSLVALYGRDNVIQGVAFNNPNGQVNAISPHGINAVVRDCQFQDMGSAVNANGKPVGLLVQDCSESLVDGLRGYFIWSEGTDHVYLGNTVPNSVGQHDIRTGGTDRLLVAYNSLTNLDRRSVDPTDLDKQALTLHTGNYAWVAHNVFAGGRCEFGPLGGADGLKEPDYLTERQRWTVIEGNVFHDSIDIDHGAEHTVLRNNYLDMPNWAQIKVDAYSSQFQRGVIDLDIYNNTSVNSGNADNFLKVNGSAQEISVMNNLYMAPNMATGANTAAPVYVVGTSLSSFKTITNNVWYVGKILDYAQGGINYLWTGWSDSGGYRTPAEWNAMSPVGTDLFSKTTIDSKYAPQAGSSAIGAGTQAPGVFVDFYGNPRPSGGITVGAVQV